VRVTAPAGAAGLAPVAATAPEGRRAVRAAAAPAPRSRRRLNPLAAIPYGIAVILFALEALLYV
jgi:hyaluronan synthase